MLEKEEKLWTDSDMRKYATEFFYHWYNTLGNNTKQGGYDRSST